MGLYAILAITSCNRFLNDFISVSRGCGGIWPIALQCDLSALVFVGIHFCTALLSILDSSLFQPFLCRFTAVLWIVLLLPWPNDPTFISRIFWYTNICTCRVPGSCGCTQPKSSPLHVCAWQIVWGVYADMLCLVFTENGTVHQGQTSLLWCRLSTWHSSRSLVACSYSTVETWALLTFSFKRLSVVQKKAILVF